MAITEKKLEEYQESLNMIVSELFDNKIISKNVLFHSQSEKQVEDLLSKNKNDLVR